MSAKRAFSPIQRHVHLGDDGLGLPIADPGAFWQDLMSGSPTTEAARRANSGGWLFSAMAFSSDEQWATWEMHPEGEEILFATSGEFNVILKRSLDDADALDEFLLSTGEFCIVPRGVWHRMTVRTPGTILFMTYGKGTENKPIVA